MALGSKTVPGLQDALSYHTDVLHVELVEEGQCCGANLHV